MDLHEIEKFTQILESQAKAMENIAHQLEDLNKTLTNSSQNESYIYGKIDEKYITVREFFKLYNVAERESISADSIRNGLSLTTEVEKAASILSNLEEFRYMPKQKYWSEDRKFTREIIDFATRAVLTEFSRIYDRGFHESYQEGEWIILTRSPEFIYHEWKIYKRDYNVCSDEVI